MKNGPRPRETEIRADIYKKIRISYTIVNRREKVCSKNQDRETQGREKKKFGRKRDGWVLASPLPRLTHPLPPQPRRLRPAARALRSHQPRPKFKLPNLFDNLFLMDPEPFADSTDAEPGTFPGKFAAEFGGECDKCESLSGRDATPLNPTLTKCARCL